MKAVKLAISAGVYFCVATVLAQAALVVALGAKGWLTRERLVLVVGALDGKRPIEPQTEKSAAPTAPSWEVLEKETMRLAASDALLIARQATAADAADDVRSAETKLETDRLRFDEKRGSFDNALAALEKETLEAGLQDVRQTIETMAPKQAKDHLLRMYEAGASEDLVKIFTTLSIDKRKKIVGEFRTAAEQKTLHEILSDVRLSQAPEPSAPDAARL